MSWDEEMVGGGITGRKKHRGNNLATFNDADRITRTSNTIKT